MQKPRFGMNGKGWAGSMARGVSMGNNWVRNTCSSHGRSASVMSPGSSTQMPAAARSPRSSFHSRCCTAIRSEADALTRCSCSPAVSPSWLTTRTPSRTWPFSPATRTM